MLSDTADKVDVPAPGWIYVYNFSPQEKAYMQDMVGAEWRAAPWFSSVSVAAVRCRCSSVCICLTDHAVCSIRLLYSWLKWQNFCSSEQPQHCWDLKHATRREKGSLLSSPCGFWLLLSSQDDCVVLIIFPCIFVHGMVEHPMEAQNPFASLEGDDLQTSAQNRLTATLNYDRRITNCYL